MKRNKLIYALLIIALFVIAPYGMQFVNVYVYIFLHTIISCIVAYLLLLLFYNR